MVGVHPNRSRSGFGQERLDLLPASVPQFPDSNHYRFKRIWGGKDHVLIFCNGFDIINMIRLFKQYGNQSGAIDDNQVGKPFSS
jgi:hypothetical protein